jgi:hypothetical protein
LREYTFSPSLPSTRDMPHFPSGSPTIPPPQRGQPPTPLQYTP